MAVNLQTSLQTSLHYRQIRLEDSNIKNVNKPIKTKNRDAGLTDKVTWAVLSLLLASSIAHSEELTTDSIPENASSALFGNSWRCNRGYQRVEESCQKITVPDNAYPTNRTHGDSWLCKRGFRKTNDTCTEIVLPEHAYLNSPKGDDWECHRRYRKSEEGCVLIKVPANAYLTNSAYGAGWKCERGFKPAKQGCEQVLVPEHAHIDRSGDDWRCDPPFRKRGQSCFAP